jgi:hypothetical protein
MRIRCRKKIGTLRLAPGDTIVLREHLDDGTMTDILTDKVTEAMTITGAVTFDVEPGDFEGATGGIGGAFLEVGANPRKPKHIDPQPQPRHRWAGPT